MIYQRLFVYSWSWNLNVNETMPMNLLGLDTLPISSLRGRSKLDSYSFYSIILLCHLDVSKNSPKHHRNMVSKYNISDMYIYIHVYIYLHDFISICKYNMTPSSSRRPSAQATPHIPKQQAPRTRVHGPQAMQEKVRWIWNLKTNGWTGNWFQPWNEVPWNLKLMVSKGSGSTCYFLGTIMDLSWAKQILPSFKSLVISVVLFVVADFWLLSLRWQDTIWGRKSSIFCFQSSQVEVSSQQAAEPQYTSL